MRILAASIMVALAACGSAPPKESAIVKEGSDVPPNCCCKTIPPVADKEIIPNYTTVGRMECSTQQGECVDDVQCNAQKGPDQATPVQDNGVPPPPTLGGSSSSPAVP